MSVLKISLRAGERIFINGAVLRPDRKVTLEFLNSVTFLLEQHVMTPENTTTPLRQLYFMIQTAIIDPKSADQALDLARNSVRLLRSTFDNRHVLAELAVVDDLLQRGRPFDCLRLLRKLFPFEDAIIANKPLPASSEPEASSDKIVRVAACQ